MRRSHRFAWLGAAAVLLVVLGMAAGRMQHWRSERAADADLRRRLASLQPTPVDAVAPCDNVAPSGTLVVLALGQSNAANHGTPGGPAPRIPMVTTEGCAWASDPLPGGTGSGGAIWSRLPAALAQRSTMPAVAMSVLAVDASTIGEWTADTSPLRARLAHHLARMSALGRPPAVVLWHQGESDARRGTSAEAYQRGLRSLADTIQAQVGPVRMLLARSTVCRQAPSVVLARAVDQLVAEDGRFALGPDLDQALLATARRDGCHLNADGLAQAAELWADAVIANSTSIRRTVAGRS